MANSKPGIDIAIPSFGYKNSVSICRTFGFIPKCRVTDAARFDGRMLRDVVTGDNTASDVWAETAYLSQANEVWLKRQSRVSCIHRKKPRPRSRSGAPVQRSTDWVRMTWRVWPPHLNMKRPRAYQRDIYLDTRHRL